MGTVGFHWIMCMGWAVSPELPEQPASEPATTTSAVTADAGGEPVSNETVVAEPFDDAQAGAPAPSDAPAVAPRAAAASEPAAAPRGRGDGPRRTVRRAEPGDWGMQFTFGGLAPLSIAGIRDHGINRLLMTELGFRRVTKPVIVQFSIGAGVFNHAPREGETENDAGLSASVGLLRPFRVWRRISPYAGGMIHFHYVDPDGRANWLFNFSLGPVIGTEFYIGDRVSLLFQGQADVGVTAMHGLMQVRAATSISAGGQTGLVFYF